MCRILEHLIPDLAAAVNKDLGGYEVRVGCGRFGLRSTYKHCRLKIWRAAFFSDSLLVPSSAVSPSPWHPDVPASN